MSKSLRYRGSRWWCPSWLEVPAGPWGTASGFQQDVVAGWKAAIDWHADHGLNVIIADIPYSQTDRIYLGWGFHYLLDLSRWPYARDLCSADFRQCNRDTLNAIFDHAQTKGVLCLTQHFNFGAPTRMGCAEGWFVQYPITEADFPATPQHHHSRTGVIALGACWTHPGYQEFMKYCWSETLKLLPGLGGFLVTPGEGQNCVIERTYLPERPDRVLQDRDHEKLLFHYQSSSTRFIQALADFIRQFTATVTKAQRKPVVRAWGMEGAPHLAPKGPTYLVKHQLFDCIDAPGDYTVKRWQNAGHEVWVEAEVFGENAGPIVWLNADYRQRIAEDIRQSGVAGAVSHINSGCEVQLLNDPSACVAFAMFHDSLREPTSLHDTKPYVATLAKSFGKHAATVFRAMELYSHGPLLSSKVAHRLGEGWIFGGWATFTDPAEGLLNLAATNGTPPPWFRGDLATVKEYVDYLDTNPWSPDALKQVRAGRRCPIAALEHAGQQAARAEKLLEKIRADLPAESMREWKVLRCSAALSRVDVECLANACRAKVLFHAVRAGLEPAPQRPLAEQCLAAMEHCEKAAAERREWLIQLPPDHAPVADLCAHQRDVYRDMAIQLQPYRRELNRFLSGEAWTLSRYDLTWRGAMRFRGPVSESLPTGPAVPVANYLVKWPAWEPSPKL